MSSGWWSVLTVLFPFWLVGAAVAEWLSYWLATQEVRGSIPRLPT